MSRQKHLGPYALKSFKMDPLSSPQEFFKFECDGNFWVAKPFD